MAGETPTPNQPITSPVTPAAPAAPPRPPERQRIQTSATKLDPTTATGAPPEKPPQPRQADGTFAPQTPTAGTPPVVTPAATPPATPPVTPPQPPPKPVRPAWLDQVALGLGFTQQEIERSDADSLGNAVALAQRHVAKAQQTQQAPAAPPPPPKVDLGLTEEQQEEFGPEMMGVLTRLETRRLEEKQQFESRLAQFEQQQQVRTQNAVAQTIEEAIVNLDPALASVVGQGDIGHIYQNDPASHRRRMFVLQTLQAKGLDFTRAPVGQIKQAIESQIREDFPWLLKPASGANPNETPQPAVSREVWAKAGSPPPTHVSGAAELEARQGGSIEDRHRGAITEEEIADEKIRQSLRNRKRNGQLAPVSQ